eukprot:451356-Rhodomonas_salina.1
MAAHPHKRAHCAHKWQRRRHNRRRDRPAAGLDDAVEEVREVGVRLEVRKACAQTLGPDHLCV